MGVRGYFIQYKFIIPEEIKHSSYTYQKLFRALYGYTQAVFKSNGKVYHYHRKGILSDVPYIRPGKNCVIIPPGLFQKLIDFFKTGRNPTHHWKGKGDWKAVYYMNEKDVDEKKVIEALVELLSRTHVEGREKSLSLFEALKQTSTQQSTGKNEANSMVLSLAQPVVESEWFKNVYSLSEDLKEFYTQYRALKSR
tara:strand:+ start:12081 stop:12665 length:585 start_codon:yes stop_codon:yes gene_type:complete